MTAFEPVRSGIASMDQELNFIRLGDNVVWQVTNLEEFSLFVKPYVQQAVEDHRNIIYIRFASHEPLLSEADGVRVISVELSHRFENFAVDIHNIIEKEGYNAFYVFDCLSELQTAWATDAMMGNFFRVTCPYLFKLDTVAYFPIIRGKHSFQAIAKIRDTTQLMFDVYSDRGKVYVRPLKVWNRYSETMFLAHTYNEKTGEFRPLLDGVEVSHFYQLMNDQKASESDQNIDSWERYFNLTKLMYEQGMDVKENCDRICNIMMSRDEKMRALIKENFTPKDYFLVKSRMIGTGLIGGKACGMLLARKLIENHRPDLFEHVEPHDSYYIGSDVFYSYIVHNDFWDLRVRQRRPEEYFSLAEECQKRIMEGTFSVNQKEQFIRMLEYYGSSPIIVRSSSILEDGFGNAFAGKYDSVFCPNPGTLEKRLEDLENAIRTVYASTMGTSVLDYRLRRGLQGRDEQMSLLIMRVSGSQYDGFFMPCAAGVGYSYSPYKFMKDLDSKEGMLRLVMGLGTGAVDRTQGSYPRLVSMDKPEATSHTTSKEKHQFSQSLVDVIDFAKGDVAHYPYDKVVAQLPRYLKNVLLEHDYETERMFLDRGQRREVLFVSCLGLVKKKELMDMMKDILALIQDAYEYPVDIEYTINITENGDFVVNLLQCRPLHIAKDKENISMPEQLEPDSIFLQCKGASMGLSCATKLDFVVMVDPVPYYEMEYKDKYLVAKALGEINWAFREKGKHMILLVPGRICTSSPELGVPTAFADISEFDAILEVSETRAGYMPELSYGSHIFQDLVEAEILYGAVFDNEKTLVFSPDFFEALPNDLKTYAPKSAELEEIVKIWDVREQNIVMYHDMKEEMLLIQSE